MDKPPLNLTTVHALMTALGIDSYAELARLAKLDRTYLSRVLRGQRPPQASLVVSLATALKVPPIVLLGPDDPDAALAGLEMPEAS